MQQRQKSIWFVLVKQIFIFSFQFDVYLEKIKELSAIIKQYYPQSKKQIKSRLLQGQMIYRAILKKKANLIICHIKILNIVFFALIGLNIYIQFCIQYSQLIIQHIELRQVKMIEETKRSLRVRKNPKYLNSDEQDPDKVSFSQLKSHHDYNSAQYQKTQDAKVLVKLINKINKNYRTYLNEILPNALEAQKNETTSKDKRYENQSQANRKSNYASKDIKMQAQTKQKEKSKPIYNFKNQYSNLKDAQQLKTTQSYINKLKQMGSIPIVGKGLYTDQLKKLQTLYPDMKNFNYQTLTQNTNPNLFGGSSLGMQSKQKQKQKQKQKAKTQQQQGVNQSAQQNSRTQIFNEQKLFKRSAYHVAIAYHIYLKNLKQKGGNIGNEIDPTYHAKKLKENRPSQ